MSNLIETSVVKRITETIELSRAMFWNAAITGAPGIGKTLTIKRYVQEDELNVGYLEVRPVIGGSMNLLLEEVGAVVGVKRYGSIVDLERALRREWFEKRVMIIDEAQNIKLNKLRQLLHLSVEDGGPFVFVFVGNDQMLKQTRTGEAAMLQINRRIKQQVSITNIDDDDADAVAEHAGVEGIEAFKLLRKIGARFHVDGIVTVIQLARELSRSKTLRIEHLSDALDHLPQFRSTLRKK